MNTLYFFLKKLWARIRFRFNYWVISDSAGEVTFAVVGNVTGRNPYCRTYLGQRDAPGMSAKWYAGSENIASELTQKYGMVVLADVPTPNAFKDNALVVPNFISLAVKLPRDMPAYFKGLSSSMRSNIRLLEKKGFTWKICDAKSWADTFYHHYYRPTMLQSHGDEAYLCSESVIMNMIQEPDREFLLISEGGKIVGAALCQIKDETYHITSMGWLEGDEVFRKKGIPSAFFWYAICHSFEIGCRRVNFGGSPPYLENGVTRFKMPWGATYCPELSTYGERTLLLNPSDPDCYKFLSSNSIVAYTADKELIVLSRLRPEESKLRDEFLKDIKAWYLLRHEENNNWQNSSHRHLPLSLRNWYEYIVPVYHRKNSKSADSKRVYRKLYSLKIDIKY